MEWSGVSEVVGGGVEVVVVVVGVVLGCEVVEVVVVVAGFAVLVGGLVAGVVSGTKGVVGGEDKGVTGEIGACVVGLPPERLTKSSSPNSKPRPEIWPSLTAAGKPVGTSRRGLIGEVSGKLPAGKRE